MLCHAARLSRTRAFLIFRHQNPSVLGNCNDKLQSQRGGGASKYLSGHLPYSFPRREKAGVAAFHGVAIHMAAKANAVVASADTSYAGTASSLDIKPNGYIDGGTDEDTGHNRRRFEGQSIHGDTVSTKISKNPKVQGIAHNFNS
jgi:hypothetical protein